MDNLNIEKFDPTVAELKSIVSLASQVVVTDINNKAQIDLVKSNRIILSDMRIRITKKGKELREDAIKFQKAVIAKEKELIEIIKPEEDRLKAFEDEVKLNKVRAERIALLPERKKSVEAIGDCVDDETLLSMDSTEFQGYLNALVSAKNERERIENERKANELKEAELKLEREKEMRDREERAREDERARAEQREKERVERELREKKEEEEREERRIAFEKEQAEKEAQRIEEEKAKLAKKEKFVEFLKTLGWTEETKNDFMLNYSPTEVKVYKLLGTYKEN